MVIAETLRWLFFWHTGSNCLFSWQLSREKRGVKSTSGAHNMKNTPAWILPLQTAVPAQSVGITLDYNPGACFTTMVCENPDGRIHKLLLLTKFWFQQDSHMLVRWRSREGKKMTLPNLFSTLDNVSSFLHWMATRGPSFPPESYKIVSFWRSHF